MRYFKYKNTNKNLNNALKEQYKTLTEDEQRTFRKEKRWRKFSMIVSCIVYILCLIKGGSLVASIPMPSIWYWKILVIAGKVLLSLCVLITGVLLTAGLTMPLWKKVESFHIPSVKKEIFSKACAHLRNYYNLQKPYIVTKCFNATDKKFQNHDVCLFIVGDELRITTDLVSGFLHGERDLGCYAFKKEEITLTKVENGKHLVAELKADDTVFLLGYRAKGFIAKNFIDKSDK